MSERFDSNERSEYVCVDLPTSTSAASEPQVADGTAADNSASSNWYPVEDSSSGGLPSPYIDNQEISCAQCSTADGPTYIRWGRSTCPTASSLVYAGHGAGGASTTTNKGGGYNYLCMHGSPQYEPSSFNSAANTVGGRVFRLQYETTNKGLWKLWKVHNEDVPCAVCQSTGALAALMQPGNSMCPTGWSTEYTGYIMSAPHNTQRGEFVCVDRDAEQLALCTGTADDGQTNCGANFAAAGGKTSAHCTDDDGAGCEFVQSDSSDNAEASLLSPVELR